MVLNANRPSPRVPLVDDHAAMLEMWRQCLKRSGVDATGAANATDALSKVSVTPPHAVLLDMGLPDVDSYDLCRLLRERPDTHRTPIIALTGPAPPAGSQRARDVGCNAVLVKPCSADYVLLELQRVLPSHLRATA